MTSTHGRYCPVVGHIMAGFPTPAEEELQDLLSLDEYLIPRPGLLSW